ncbi:MAG: LacI family DNA-binding transcriptional regulator [Actinobacteria bacterium]|nr:LacI family DNA-binding transcriptional regulator [Actinomycetota bacterium]
MRQRIGIKEVAAAAGVSTTTVSHALSGKGRLPEGTRARVREVAEQLGYRPNVSARKLGGGSTGLLALAVSQVEDLTFQLGDFDYFASLIREATTAALDRGYALAIAPAAAAEDALHKIPADGALVVDPVPDDASIAYLRGQGVPIVTTGRLLDDGDGYWVDNDHAAGVGRVLDHLHAVGARRIALVAPRSFASYIVDVRAGYAGWCAAHDCEEIVGIAPDVTEQGGFAASSALLSDPDPPDAIYAVLDRLAIGVLLAAAAADVDVPGDLRVAACTDSVAAQTARPPLTTLGLNPEQIGREAIGLLIDLVEGLPVSPGHRLVPTTLIERESTLGSPARAR